MPAIIRPQPSKVGRNQDPAYRTSKELIANASYKHARLPILHSSFADLEAETSPNVVPHENGFVHTVLRAFQQDLHLELRPDDVWLAIISQLSFFINGHSEELRSFFVRHEGQKVVAIDMRPHTLNDVDIDMFIERLKIQVQGELNNPAVAEWMLPRFSTSTQTDATVAAMVFLGSLKEFFEYRMMIGCGFPSVTLHGTREDWELIRQCVSRFTDLGDFQELRQWVTYLDCVLKYMVAGFDQPEHPEVKDFWMRAAHTAGQRASGGLVTLSGWLTAFCLWQGDGTRTYAFSDEEIKRELGAGTNPEEWARLELSGVSFPVIGRYRIPGATVNFPVIVLDGFTEEKTVVVAGLIGMEVGGAELSVAKPRPGWWLLHEK
ncbi:hypothetical protein EDB81DRAFT_334148 [Dactylonectria macrodidyma]|uniref:Uncharacterized protein n=1 Tax=Dactylonectria macrodidyma TaxID=307937 RepID=A0A9P9JJG1_9HYPO|nr:hypothetical protein EDB81DRAFT_334148 [Dactylonectria macrodidyma]